MFAEIDFAFDAYVGIWWLDRGRDRRGCDCWGLLRLVYREGAGITLPGLEYGGIADRDAIAALVAGGRTAWSRIPIADARAFDAVLLHADPWHVGVVVRPGTMLHVPEGRSSVIEPFTCGRFGRRVEGVYRHETLR